MVSLDTFFAKPPKVTAASLPLDWSLEFAQPSALKTTFSWSSQYKISGPNERKTVLLEGVILLRFLHRSRLPSSRRTTLTQKYRTFQARLTCILTCIFPLSGSEVVSQLENIHLLFCLISGNP